MLFAHAMELVTHGKRVRRLAWAPRRVYRAPVDVLTVEDTGAADWVLVSEAQSPLAALAASAAAVPTFFQPKPTQTKEGKKMASIKSKTKSPAKLTGTFGGKPAAILLVEKVESSNPDAALALVGKDGKSVDVLALAEAKKVTVTVDCYLKDEDGHVHEVVGAKSNEFDIVDLSVMLVPVLGDDGLPKPEADANGNPVVDPLTGQAKPLMEPAKPTLAIEV